MPSPLSEPFWAAVREHRLELQRCTVCGRWEWTPQVVCSHCLTDTLAWTPVSGLGTVYTYSVVNRPQSDAFGTPYVVSMVELDEGPRLMANVVGIPPDEVRIGMRVQVGFEDFENLSIFNFSPLPGG
jgi:uncharacterized protein